MSHATEENARNRYLTASRRLALAAGKVCDELAGDRVVDALRAALSEYEDAYDAWVHR